MLAYQRTLKKYGLMIQNNKQQQQFIQQTYQQLFFFLLLKNTMTFKSYF